MTEFMISARCTREEYMEYCVKRHKPLRLLRIVGVLFLVAAVALYIWQQQATQTGLLMVLLGLIGVTLDWLWLPLFRKGEAARRYDASDALSQAFSLTLTDEALTVKTAAIEGTLPLSFVTAVEETDAMIAVVCGGELTVPIPKRALSEAEITALRQALRKE